MRWIACRAPRRATISLRDSLITTIKSVLLVNLWPESLFICALEHPKMCTQVTSPIGGNGEAPLFWLITAMLLDSKTFVSAVFLQFYVNSFTWLSTCPHSVTGGECTIESCDTVWLCNMGMTVGRWYFFVACCNGPNDFNGCGCNTRSFD